MCVNDDGRFASWNVEVRPSKTIPGPLDLEFDSPLLKRRVTNSVFLPSSYRENGDPRGVMYYLHGTVLPSLDNPALRPVTDQEALLQMIGAGGGHVQTKLQDFPSQRTKADFLVVAPDTDRDETWCETCWWIDGQKDVLPNVRPVSAEVMPAESFLYEELMPLVESVFNVRKDAGGRGITGFSMGAAGAWVQGLRHPDRFSYVAPISGAYDIVSDPLLTPVIESFGYMRDQGYSPWVLQNEWPRFNPKHLIGNFAGQNVKLTLSGGDACLGSSLLTAPDCRTYSPVRNPAAATVELILRRNLDQGAKDMARIGVEADQVRSPGVHGANNHRIYADHIVPTANRIFGSTYEPNPTFSYRSRDQRFDIWGYHVSMAGAVDEFLSMEHVWQSGREFALRGHNVTEVVTPRKFDAGQSYRVTTTAADGTSQTRQVRADEHGRLTVKVDLTKGMFGPQQGPLSKVPGWARVKIAG